MARLNLMNATAIPAASTVTTTPVGGLGDVGDLTVQFFFDYGSGGTSVTAYLQTSLDGGTTWVDIAAVAFLLADETRYFDINAGASIPDNWQATDGTLTADTSVDGILGDMIRVKYVVVGTYVASTLSVYVSTRTGVGGGTSGLDASSLAALESVTATIQPTAGALTDRSGTLTAGGTAQNAAALNASRKYLYLENPVTETERLWFSTTGTAVASSPSISLEPGQSYENPAHFCPTGAVSVIAATTSHAWTAREA